MLKLRKLFKLPTPKQLGKSEYNALPMRDFTPWEKEYCWEDYYDQLKAEYPVRYFLAETLPKFIRYKMYFPIAVPVSNAWYWFKSHFMPGKKYHLLDLRQPCVKGGIANFDCYRYGWCDVPEKMLYAMFNLLKEYFDEEPYDLTKDYTEEEIEADEGLKQQQFCYNEAKAILYWWQVERKEELAVQRQLTHEWSELRHTDTGPDNPVTLALLEKSRLAEEEFQNKTDEMIARLMKIRRTLWT